MKKGFCLISVMFLIMTLLCGCNKKAQIFYDLKENDVLVNQYNGEIKINDNLAEILKDVLVTREGYKFLGWSLDGTNLMDHNTVVESKEVKVIPIFTKLSYTITYKIEGQEDIVQTYGYQDEIKAPNNPTKEGYNFNGWDKTIPDKMPAQNLEFKAIFTKLSYTITYKIEGQEDIVQTYEYQDEIKAPNNPTKEGYNFNGWDKTIPDKMPAQNLEFEAIFTKLSYTITYKIEGEEDIVHTYEYQEPIDVYNSVNVLGYEFLGWDNEIPQTMPSHNLVLNANLQMMNYGITYLLDGGTGSSLIQTYNIDMLPLTLKEPTKEGYLFKGYKLDDETIFELSLESIPNLGNLVLQAVWEKKLSAMEASGKDVIFIGHAGSYLGIMNSEEAFINGVKIKKYQALECDLKQTKDGVFVVCHDDTFNNIAIANTNWEDLKDIEYTTTRGGISYTTKICTLERYLEICKEYNVYAVIELKYSNGIKNKDTSRMSELMKIIDKYHMLDKIIFLGSQYKCLEWVRNNGYDHIPCQYLVNSIESRDTFERCVSWNFDISFNISYSNSQEWIDRYHEAGIDVACYTFNQYTSIETLQEWIDKGVDFVTCDVLTQNDIILPDREWINTLPTYKVIFKDIDGNILKEAIVREGYNAVAPFNPVKEGYEFIGWDQEFTNVTKDIVVNALYHIKTYKIIYDANLNTKTIQSWQSKDEFIEEFYTDLFEWLNSKVGIISGLTKIDQVYQFVANSGRYGTATWSSVEELKAIDIYIFEQTIGTLIYKPIEGTNSDNYVPVDDENYFLNTYPYRIKYQEMNAYLLNVIKTSYPSYSESFKKTSAGKVQIFFRFHQWQKGTNIPAFDNLPNKYVINEITGVSPILPTVHLTYSIIDEFILEKASCNGYIFIGWYLNSDCSGDPVTNITEGTTGDLRLYARWVKE